MLRTLKLVGRLTAVSFRSKLQYKASFWTLTVAYFFSTVIEVVGIGVLFARFHSIKGWDFEEVLLLYAVISMGFATAECLTRGFDKFSILVRHGGFDRMLLRPVGTLLQVAVSEVQPMRVGRWIQALLLLLWSMDALHLTWFSMAGVVVLLCYCGVSCLFYGLMILQATCSFWSTESLEIFNIATYGGLEAARFPLSIYDRPMRFLFTFVIPLGCVAYLPLASILEQEAVPQWVGLVGPFAGGIFLLACCALWRVGVRHYNSVGS